MMRIISNASVFVFFGFNYILPFLEIILTKILKNNDIKSKTKASDHNALFATVPMTVLPIPIVSTLVRVEAGFVRLVGKSEALPMTI